MGKFPSSFLKKVASIEPDVSNKSKNLNRQIFSPLYNHLHMPRLSMRLAYNFKQTREALMYKYFVVSP